MRPDKAPHVQAVPHAIANNRQQTGGHATARPIDAAMPPEQPRMTTSNENSQDTARPTGETVTMTNTQAFQHATPSRLEGQRLDYVPETTAIKALTPEKARQRLEQTRADYLAQREKLAPAAQELNRLRKIRAAAEQQSKQAGENWRQGFLEDFGKRGKEIREQQKAEREWRLEVEQTEAMIELLEPQVEWLRLHTQIAREEFQRNRRNAREVLGRHALLEAVKALCATDEAQEFYATLPALFDAVAEDLCNNAPYMAHHFGVDVSAEPGTAIKSSLNNQENSRLDFEIRQRQYAAIGEMVWRLRPEVRDAKPEGLADLEPLASEDARNIYGGTIARARRLKELETTLGSAAH
ncbi:hypothetical protein B4O83_13760 [Chromohalobacter israelensis]|nr:hypothetical protein B4O83_13760 [Chromohalobacter salexigens]